MAPKLVTPCRISGKGGKNDAADAAEIAEAMQRPNICFGSVKAVDLHGRLMVHPTREGFGVQRTAVIKRRCGPSARLTMFRC